MRPHRLTAREQLVLEYHKRGEFGGHSHAEVIRYAAAHGEMDDIDAADSARPIHALSPAVEPRWRTYLRRMFGR